MTATTLDLVIELRTSGAEKLITEVASISGVLSSSLLLQDGETSF